MIVALDASALILLLDREAAGPVDSATGKRVVQSQERLAFLAKEVGKARGGRLIIPTPAFAEAAVRFDLAKAAQYLQIFERLRAFRVADFDKLAALEFALMQRQLLSETPRRRRRAEIETRAKGKFDQQIVAIAKVERAVFIVTDDEGLSNYARRFDLEPRRTADLPLPLDDAQGHLDLEPSKNTHKEDEVADDNDESARLTGR